MWRKHEDRGWPFGLGSAIRVEVGPSFSGLGLAFWVEIGPSFLVGVGRPLSGQGFAPGVDPSRSEGSRFLLGWPFPLLVWVGPSLSWFGGSPFPLLVWGSPFRLGSALGVEVGPSSLEVGVDNFVFIILMLITYFPKVEEKGRQGLALRVGVGPSLSGLKLALRGRVGFLGRGWPSCEP